MNIGVYQTKSHLFFCADDTRGAGPRFCRRERYVPSEIEGVAPTYMPLSVLFKDAAEELKFSSRDDFYLVVDFPLAHGVAQMVPFPESRLSASLLDSYLEDEIPDDVDRYLLDYKLLEVGEKGCSIIGFWIARELLDEWCDLADEMSLNALDIQPAEMLLLCGYGKDPVLNIRHDHTGALRYGALCNRNALPWLTLGRCDCENKTPEQLASILRFQGADWTSVKKITLAPGLQHLSSLAQILGVAEVEVLEYSPPEFFALEAARLSSRNSEGHLSFFNYRVGEYAPRGLAERLLLPSLVAGLAFCFLFGALTFQNIAKTRAVKKETVAIREVGLEYHNKLFPQFKLSDPYDDIMQKIKINRKRVGFTQESDDGNSDEHGIYSSLQVLGMLYQFVPADKELLIEDIAITQRSIQLKGQAEDLDVVGLLEKGFLNQKLFESPSLRQSEKLKKIPGEPTSYQVTFKTKYLGDKG